MGAVDARVGQRQLPGKPRLAWYGASPAWQCALERGLSREHYGKVRRQHGYGLTWRDSAGWLCYQHDGLCVPGRREPVPVTVCFFEQPPYSCWGLPPEDYPRIYADCGAQSKHRMPDDDALCLYFPGSPPSARWSADDGLLALFNLVRDHLYFEEYWRHTGGMHGGEWLGSEAAHGFPVERAS